MKLAKKPLKVATAQTREAPLTKLERVTIRLMEFENDHQGIFAQYRELQEAVTVAEDEVRTWAKQRKTGANGDIYIVKYAEGHHRWYDADVLEARLRDTLGDVKAMALIEANDLIITHEEVDEKVLKALVKLKKIPEEIAKAAFKEEPTSARVTIERKG